MSQATRRWISEKVKSLRDSQILPFHDILDADMVDRALAAEGVTFHERIYTPLVTLSLFLSQVIDPDHSCRAAVARLIVWMAVNKRKPCEPDTSSYCEARLRLPEGVIVRLVRETARRTDGRASDAWLWKGRSVTLVDGTTASMPDTLGEPGGVPAVERPRDRPGVPAGPDGRVDLAGHRGGARPGHGPVSGQGDGRDGAVPHALGGPRAGRDRAGRPVFRLVLRDRGALGAGRRRPVPDAPAAEVRLPPGPTAGRRRTTW